MYTQERYFICPFHQDNKAKCETHMYLEKKEGENQYFSQQQSCNNNSEFFPDPLTLCY